ncbi:L,D-transpeptidase family protein [Porcincola intestinalis]|uniref:L,D-transpeptidase family protein n=1 Tax=Porcincola intestinalis TaxID=2606632 RepID=UPI002A811F3A|nr:peptidoglycan binding domain-containing protein [Porcincola intestinalis]MDY4203903.1 peptidoglycan binding domain-containing protein [Porcincola intestinalis]
MNRGNLAEDPRVDRPSSSRYTRYGREGNALLYVSDREWKKVLADEKAASASKSRKKSSAGVKNVHSAKRNVYAAEQTQRRDKGVSAPAAAFSKLEVGMHGRLFGVKENPAASALESEKRRKANEPARRSEPAAGGKASGEKTASDLEKRMEEASSVFGTVKMARPYLNAPNPLLESRNIRLAESQNPRGAESRNPRPAESRKTRQTESRMLRPAENRNPRGVESRNIGLAESRNPGPAGPEADGKQQVRAERSQRTASTVSLRKVLVASGVGLLTAGYIAAGVHFSDHFYPSTEFFGIKASGLTVEEVKRQVEKKVEGYQLQIKERSSGGSNSGAGDRITADEVGMKYRDNGMIDRAMRQQYPAVWPAALLKTILAPNEETLGTEYDSSLADSVIRNLTVFDSSRVIKPRNAELKYTADGAVITKEVMGTRLDYDKTKTAIIHALNDGSTSINLEKEGLYQNPEVYADDDALNEKANALNQVLGANVTLEMGDQSVQINPEMTAETFLSLDMDGNYYVDDSKVSSYIVKLADKTDTVGRKRTFHTSLGTTVELEGGDYGWTLDADSTAQELEEALKEKKKGTLEPVYFTTGLCRDKNDIGNTYVEIDLTNQHMWFYKNGSLIVDTPVVTGNPQKNNETPSGGVWSLKGKYRNATLKGEGYATPVDYWLPFNGGVGIHDLQKRYYFGGSVYNGAGSHGCINTPLAAVKLIYNGIGDGTPVVVYKDDSQEAVSQNTGMQDIRTITSYIEAQYGTVSDDGASERGTSGSTQSAEVQR